jgi:uncharacterized protein
MNFDGRFTWYELLTRDVETAKAFYREVMGWGVWDTSAPGSSYSLFTAGERSVGGLMGLPEAAMKMGGQASWVGYVGVPDVDFTISRVTSLGGSAIVPPTEIANVSRFAIFTDPQTARLGVLSWRDPASQPPLELGALGRVGWHELLALEQQQALAFYAKIFGWQLSGAQSGELGTYQLFSAAGQTIGGIVTKPPTMPAPHWLYYFNVGDIDAAAHRVKAGGGQPLEEPIEIAGGSWIVQCRDPHGALFGLEGKRGRKLFGYFERVNPRDPADPHSRRWSW